MNINNIPVSVPVPAPIPSNPPDYFQQSQQEFNRVITINNAIYHYSATMAEYQQNMRNHLRSNFIITEYTKRIRDYQIDMNTFISSMNNPPVPAPQQQQQPPDAVFTGEFSQTNRQYPVGHGRETLNPQSYDSSLTTPQTSQPAQSNTETTLSYTGSHPPASRNRYNQSYILYTLYANPTQGSGRTSTTTSTSTTTTPAQTRRDSRRTPATPARRSLEPTVTPFPNITLPMEDVTVAPTDEQFWNAIEAIGFHQIGTHTRCPISLEEFGPSDLILRIRHCGHVFKLSNLSIWFCRSVRCPVCRYDIRDYVRPPDVSNNVISRDDDEGVDISDLIYSRGLSDNAMFDPIVISNMFTEMYNESLIRRPEAQSRPEREEGEIATESEDDLESEQDDTYDE